MLVSWNWLKDYLGSTQLNASTAAELLGIYAFELEGITPKGKDTVIEVDILPNRSSDCLCHRGIARELSSITGVPLVHDPLRKEFDVSTTDVIEVRIENSEACPRFTASLITGIEVKESPEWLQKRLQAIGQRSINNIVDATNYVMFAVGQPIHAYDAELFPQVNGKWKFDIRTAQAGEVVSLLAEGGKDESRDIELYGTETLVVDGSSDIPIGLAGVKGGRFAGISTGTTKIIIESAHWHPTMTRQTARRLGIVIDASKRFENEPSRELPLYAQTEIIKLILDIAGGTCEGMVDVYLEKHKSTTVAVDTRRVNTLLGLSLSTDEMMDILHRIGATVNIDDQVFTVTGPWERTDLTTEEDFIEEIGRLHGYDYVKAIPPLPVALDEYNSRHYYSERIRPILIGMGFSEVVTSSFRNRDQVQLKNALASDKTYLRSSLIKNISEVLDKNVPFQDLLGTIDTRVFEIGTVFTKVNGEVTEHLSLCVGVRLKPSGYSGKEDKILTEVYVALQNILDVSFEWKVEKGVAETNFTEIIATLPLPTAYDSVLPSDAVVYQPFSVYPSVSRDIAMWVGEFTTVDEVATVLRAVAGDLLVRLTHIDTFTKNNRTSMAFRFVFQSNEKTLTDEAINNVMNKVYVAATKQGWETR